MQPHIIKNLFNMFDQTLTFLDTETTGTNASNDRIIEVGMIKVKNGKILNRFNSLVNPHTNYIHPYISYLTGIKYRELEDAPDFESLSNEILSFTKNSIVVAHNARFDQSFLLSEFNRYDKVFKRHFCCSLKLSRRLYPQYSRHSLSELIKRFKIKCDLRHRALADAEVIYKFFDIIQADHSKIKFTQVFNNSIL